MKFLRNLFRSHTNADIADAADSLAIMGLNLENRPWFDHDKVTKKEIDWYYDFLKQNEIPYTYYMICENILRLAIAYNVYKAMIPDDFKYPKDLLLDHIRSPAYYLKKYGYASNKYNQEILDMLIKLIECGYHLFIDTLQTPIIDEEVSLELADKFLILLSEGKQLKYTDAYYKYGFVTLIAADIITMHRHYKNVIAMI